MLKIAAYHKPTTLVEAAALLAEDGRTIIAGGTDLLVNPRYMVGVREVVDIRKLRLNYIGAENGWLHIGAGATMRTVAQQATLQRLANGILARGAAVCGSPNIRNMATLVGNIASALPSADTPPALLALNAEVVLVGTNGERVVPLDNFFVGPAHYRPSSHGSISPEDECGGRGESSAPGSGIGPPGRGVATCLSWRLCSQ